MTKKILLTIGALAVIFFTLAGIKVGQFSSMMKAGESMQMPAQVVSSAMVEELPWESTLSSVGSLEAALGVVVTADLSGRVTGISFTSGNEVKKGQILVTQDTSAEEAQLRAAEANVALSQANLKRAKELIGKGAVSKSELDTAEATYKSAVASADNVRAAIEKKSIKAPFDGTLGVRQINIGQDLAVGTPIVSLQAVDPIFANFSVPQRQLNKIARGLKIRLTTDALPDEIFEGLITAIDSRIDERTRNIRLQASLDNKDKKLLPGMYAKIDIVLPAKKDKLVIPNTAVLYATYGDSVFVIEDNENGGKVARQQFIRLGEARGDFVTVEEGLKLGDEVVTAGVFKLQNGAAVEIKNEKTLDYSLDPKPSDS